MTDADAELQQLFVDEANERLDRFVAGVLAVERGEPFASAVDGLFREVHTVKGAAGMLELDGIRTVAHAVEDLLAAARERGELAADLIPLLLEAADTLRSQVAGSPEQPPGLLGRLQDACARIEAGARAASAPHEAPADAQRPSARPEPTHLIRVPAEKVDRLLELTGETALHHRRLEHELRASGRGAAEGALGDELDLGARLLDDLTRTAVAMRTLPLRSIFGPFPRTVRDLAARAGKEVELVITGADTELDRVILERLSEPLVHLLSNAVAHGIEPPDERVAAGKPRSGRIELAAAQRGSVVEITVADDGRGVPEQALREAERVGSLVDVLAQPGYSTAREVTDVSGRGVGVDAVKAYAQAMGGTLDATSAPGAGTRWLLSLPLTLAQLEVLLVERDGGTYGLPLAAVEEVLALGRTHSLAGERSIELRGEPVPLADLAALLGAGASGPLPPSAPAVLVTAAGRRVAVACERLIGKEEVLLSSLGALLEGLPGYLGSAVLGDGSIALVVDPRQLVQAPRRREDADRAAEPRERTSPNVLVVEDSFTVRELQRSILEAAGYRVETASDGREALRRISSNGIDLVVTDIEMPVMDGLELTRAIRARAESASLPVVILTSRNVDAEREAGIEAGADAYMVKQRFDQRTLLETVERLVGR